LNQFFSPAGAGDSQKDAYGLKFAFCDSLRCGGFLKCKYSMLVFFEFL